MLIRRLRPRLFEEGGGEDLEVGAPGGPAVAGLGVFQIIVLHAGFLQRAKGFLAVLVGDVGRAALGENARGYIVNVLIIIDLRSRVDEERRRFVSRGLWFPSAGPLPDAVSQSCPWKVPRGRRDRPLFSGE